MFPSFNSEHQRLLSAFFPVDAKIELTELQFLVATNFCLRASRYDRYGSVPMFFYLTFPPQFPQSSPPSDPSCVLNHPFPPHHENLLINPIGVPLDFLTPFSLCSFLPFVLVCSTPLSHTTLWSFADGPMHVPRRFALFLLSPPSQAFKNRPRHVRSHLPTFNPLSVFSPRVRPFFLRSFASPVLDGFFPCVQFPTLRGSRPL